MREAGRHHRPVRVRDLRHRSGPGALDAVQRDLRRAVRRRRWARSIYTPVLDARGGFRSDLTVMRLGDDHFRVVTGGAHGMADRKWFADQLPADGSAQARPTSPTSVLHDRALGPAGPRHPRLADRRRRRHDGLRLPAPAASIDGRRRMHGAGLPDLLRRRARLGALRADGAAAPSCGTMLLEAGAPHGAVPVGIGVYGTTGRHREGLPRLRLRARRRAHASSRPACSGPR